MNAVRQPIRRGHLSLICRFRRSVQLFAEATVLPVITQVTAGHILEVSPCNKKLKTFLESPTLLQQRTPWRSLCNTSVLQGHSVGTSDQGLSLDTDGGMTGQESSVGGLQELPVQCQGVKTRVF
jgi:hypothetical protein